MDATGRPSTCESVSESGLMGGTCLPLHEVLVLNERPHKLLLIRRQLALAQLHALALLQELELHVVSGGGEGHWRRKGSTWRRRTL